MIALAWFLLFAANSSVELVDDVIHIRAHEWRDADIDLRQRPGRIVVRFDTAPDRQPVKISLIRHEDRGRMSKGQPHEVLAELAPAQAGHMDFLVPAPDVYSLVVRNLSDEPARVHLRVWVNYPRVTTVSPERRLTVILLSFAFFFGTVTFSARRLLRGIRR